MKLFLRSPSLFYLDFTTGQKSRNPKGAVKFFPLPLLFSRKQIPVDEIFVHKNYTATGAKVNDIALLRLGDSTRSLQLPFDTLTTILLSGERVNLSIFSPVCLPTEMNIIDQGHGHIFGRFSSSEEIFMGYFFRMGFLWTV